MWSNIFESVFDLSEICVALDSQLFSSIISMIFHKLYCVFFYLIPFKIYHRYSDNNLFVSPRCHIKLHGVNDTTQLNSEVSMTQLSDLTPRCLFDKKKNIYR